MSDGAVPLPVAAADDGGWQRLSPATLALSIVRLGPLNPKICEMRFATMESVLPVMK